MNLLWTEKYKPESFEVLSHNDSVNLTLQNLISQGDMPHLIIYGPDGGGKKTRVNCLLAKLYGKNCLKTSRSTYTTKNNTTTIEIPIRSSRNHIEMMPSEAGHNDVFVLIKLMKETAANSMGSTEGRNNFLTFVLYDAENLTLKAQAALRRTMEKYSNKIRIVMVCLTISTLIPALKSRCLMIRNPSPQESEISSVLFSIVKKEGLKNISEDQINIISQRSERSMRKAILALQACVATKDFSDSILQDHWKMVVEKSIVDKIPKDRTVEAVKRSRITFYELLTCQVPGDMIIREILFQLLQKCKLSEGLITELKEAAVSCEKQMQQGERTIIYLEAFFVKTLLIFERAVNK